MNQMPMPRPRPGGTSTTTSPGSQDEIMAMIEQAMGMHQAKSDIGRQLTEMQSNPVVKRGRMRDLEDDPANALPMMSYMQQGLQGMPPEMIEQLIMQELTKQMPGAVNRTYQDMELLDSGTPDHNMGKYLEEDI